MKQCKECTRPVFGGGYCKAHGYLRTDKKPKPIPKVSKKMKGPLSEYSREKQKFMKEHPRCQAQLPGCQYYAVDIHHAKGREGALLLDQSWWVSVCRYCHDSIHTHDKQARELGLLLSKHKKAS